MANKYFDIYLKNPFKTYNKIKKYFKPVRLKFKISFRKSNKAKLLEIYSCDLLWKDKFDSPRHEYDPRIFISLFNHIHIYMFFKVGDFLDSTVYWESALYWLYYNKSLSEAVTEASGWTQYNKETKQEEPIKFTILKEPYQSMYNNNKLQEIYYENRR